VKHQPIEHDQTAAILSAINQPDLGQLLECVVAFSKHLGVQSKDECWAASLKAVFGASQVSLSNEQHNVSQPTLPEDAKAGEVWIKSGKGFCPTSQMAADANCDCLAFVLENTAKSQAVIRLDFATAPNLALLEKMTSVAVALSHLWQDQGSATSPEGVTHQDILAADNPYSLTRSETRVCYALKEGMRPALIAEHLGVGIATIRTHLSNIYAKTDLPSQTAVVRQLTMEATPTREAAQ